jgi:hypothetical protein
MWVWALSHTPTHTHIQVAQSAPLAADGAARSGKAQVDAEIAEGERGREEEEEALCLLQHLLMRERAGDERPHFTGVLVYIIYIYIM